MIDFKEYLKPSIRVMAIDMETATLFIAGFANQISVGAFIVRLPDQANDC